MFTGEDTPPAAACTARADRVGDRTFALTYADGVADIDLAAELAHHRRHGDLATMAVVRPELQFGVTEIGEDDRVSGFHEKPRSDHWINGGFFFLEPGVLDYLDDSSVLEREPLEGLATDGKLHVWRHTGFWECMDTYKDAVTLNDLWAGQAPWGCGTEAGHGRRPCWHRATGPRSDGGTDRGLQGPGGAALAQRACTRAVRDTCTARSMAGARPAGLG